MTIIPEGFTGKGHQFGLSVSMDLNFSSQSLHW